MWSGVATLRRSISEAERSWVPSVSSSLVRLSGRALRACSALMAWEGSTPVDNGLGARGCDGLGQEQSALTDRCLLGHVTHRVLWL